MEEFLEMLEKYGNDEIDIEKILDNQYLNFSQFLELMRIEHEKVKKEGKKLKYLDNIKEKFILLDYGKYNYIAVIFISPIKIYQKYGEYGINYYLSNHWMFIDNDRFKKLLS